MKKLLLLMLLLGQVAFSQLQFQDNCMQSLNVNFDAINTIDKCSPHVGVELQGSVKPIYARTGFQTLEIANRQHFVFQNAVGLNLTLKHTKDLCLYSGLRGGVATAKHARMYSTVGAELGFDYRIVEDVAVGIRGTMDRRSDGEAFHDGIKAYHNCYLVLRFKI
jgi:hypothetical protein